MNKHRERLLRVAQRYWKRGESVPVDLACDMVSAGLDVTALEQSALEEIND